MRVDGHPDLRQTDPDVFAALKSEERRQLDGLELIASENYASAAVMEAVGSVFTNKYAEGYPGKRYYGGCGNVDEIERLAIQRAKELFAAEHANVQAHSGSAPNMAVYFAALEYGDTVLGMELAHGGHLTHGHPKNFSGRQYNFAAYGVDSESEQIDYDAVRSIARKVKPKLIVCGYTAYPRIIDFAAFREIADETGALLMADIAHIAGLVVGGAHPSPVPFCDFVTTSTHKTLRGPRGGLVLCRREFARAVDSAIFPGTQGGPLMHVIAGKAVALKEAGLPEFAGYAARVVENARALAEGLTEEGLRLVSGGTDNHLMLIDFGPTEPQAAPCKSLWKEPASPPTRTPCPVRPASRPSPPASDSVPPRSPPADSALPKCVGSRAGSGACTTTAGTGRPLPPLEPRCGRWR